MGVRALDGRGHSNGGPGLEVVGQRLLERQGTSVRVFRLGKPFRTHVLPGEEAKRPRMAQPVIRLLRELLPETLPEFRRAVARGAHLVLETEPLEDAGHRTER